MLAFDDVEGRAPELPWRARELERVLAALHALADGLTPSPIPLEPASEALGRLFGGWRRIVDGGVDFERRVPAHARERYRSQ